LGGCGRRAHLRGPGRHHRVFPWQLFTAVRETPERFFPFGRSYEEVRVLPKRALADRSSIYQLGEFLRASVGRQPLPA
jgi:hypothetical protein